jgi:hypothetical protein
LTFNPATVRTQTTRVEQALRSLGLLQTADNTADGDTRTATLQALNMLNRVFPSNPPLPALTTYDAAAVERIQNAVNAQMGRNQTMEKLQAMVDGNTAFLVKDVPALLRGTAQSMLQEIYDRHGPNGRAAAAAEVLGVAAGSDPEIARLRSTLQAQNMINRLPDATRILAQRGQFFQDVAALNQAGLFSAAMPATPGAPPAAAASAEPPPLPDPEQVLNSALASVRRNIGSDATGDLGDADRARLKTSLAALQNDAFFGQGWAGLKTGMFSPEFLAHLNTRITAMPQTTDAERTQHQGMQQFASSLSVLVDRGVELRTARDRMSTAQASLLVESTLQQLAPMLNSTMRAEQASAEERLNNLPEWIPEFARDFIRDHAVSDRQRELLATRIPDVETPDGVMDLNSQASLQSLIIVLTSPEVMGIAGHESGVYTPALGQQIISNMDRLRQVLEDKKPASMSDEEFGRLQALLTADNAQRLIDSLDVLYERGMLTDQQLISHGMAARISPVALGILRDQAAVLKDENPDALRFMDALSREYAGRTNGLMVLGVTDTDPMEGVDASLSRAQRLQQFYQAARERYTSTHGGSDDGFDLYMQNIINAAAMLPFGTNEERGRISDGVRSAMGGDGARVGDSIVAAVDGVRPGGASPAFNRPSHRMEDIQLDPRIANLHITSGGREFSGQDILNGYKNINEGMNVFVQNGMTFRDDAGNVYIASLDTNSMIFSAQRVDMARMRELLAQVDAPSASSGGSLTPEAEAAFRQAAARDPALSLIFPPDGRMMTGGMGYQQYMRALVGGTNVSALSEFPTQAPVRVQPAPVAQVAAGGEGGSRDEAPPVLQRVSRNMPGPSAGPDITQTQIRDIMGLASASRVYPHTFNDPAIMETLRAASEQSLHIGSMERSTQRISHVDVSQAGGNQGPKISYYEASTQTLHVVDQSVMLPNDSTIADTRAELAGNGWIEHRHDTEGIHALLRSEWLKQHPERVGMEEPVDASQIQEFRRVAGYVLGALEWGNDTLAERTAAMRALHEQRGERPRGLGDIFNREPQANTQETGLPQPAPEDLAPNPKPDTGPVTR